MPLAAIPAIVAATGIAAGGSIAAGAIGAHAAGKAATTQAQAAEDAAQLQHSDAEQALDFNKQNQQNQLKLESPYTTAGAGAVTNLANLLGVESPEQLAQPAPPSAADLATQSATSPTNYAGKNFNELVNSNDPNVSPNQQTTQQWKAQGVPFQNITTPDGRTVAVKTQPTAAAAPATTAAGTPATTLASLINPSLGAPGSLSKGFDQTFTAPTNVTEQNDPGYQFRLDQGKQAIERSAAASGGLLSGGTLKDLTDYEQGQASNEYSNVYNRAFGEFQNSYNIFKQNQTDQYNRIANLAGLGQVSTQQLGSEGQASAQNAGNILLASGQQQGNALNNAAAARASGYVGGANAYGGAITGAGSSLLQGVLLNSLLNKTPAPTTAGV